MMNHTVCIEFSFIHVRGIIADSFIAICVGHGTNEQKMLQLFLYNKYQMNKKDTILLIAIQN